MATDDQVNEVPPELDAPAEGASPAPAPPPPPPPKPRGSVRVRRIAVAVLVVLTTLGFTASLIAVWSYRQVLNTSVFTSRVESIVADPEVTAALSAYVTDEIFKAIDPQKLAADALPAQAQVLVGPLVAAIRQFVETTTERILAQPDVQKVFVGAVELAHKNALKLIEGEKVAGLEVQGNQVVLNTLPVIDQVLQHIGDEGIFGRKIDIPTLTDSTGAPSQQIQDLAQRLGVELPADFGQLTVLQSDSLEQAQEALKLIRQGLALLLIGTLVLFVVTLLLSTNRWRTFAQLGIGIAIGMLVTRFIVRQVNNQILELVKNPDNLPAIRAIDSSFFGTLDSLTILLIVSGLVIAALGFFFGRSDTAARVRAGAATQAVRAGRSVGGARNPVSAFVVGHPDGARLIALAVGVGLLLWSGFSTSGIVVALIVAAVLLLVIEVIVRRAGQGLAADPAGTGDPVPTSLTPPAGPDPGASAG